MRSPPRVSELRVIHISGTCLPLPLRHQNRRRHRRHNCRRQRLWRTIVIMKIVVIINTIIRYQMLLQGQGVRQSVGWLGRFVRCFEARSPGDVEESGGSETECVSGSASSLGVRGTHTAGQGCYLPVRPSSCPDLKNPDGHWKGREYCEEPQRAIVAVAGSTHGSARPSVGASGQTRAGDATQGGGGPRVRFDGSSGWSWLLVGCRPTRFGRRRGTCSGVSWRSWGGYHYQPPQEWHRSQGAIEDLSTKFAEMQQYIGNITTQYSAFQAEVMLVIQTLTNQQKQSAPIVYCGPVPVTPRASPQLLQSSQSKRPAGDKADGDDSPRKFMVGADDDDLLIDQLGQPSDLQPDLAQESL